MKKITELGNDEIISVIESSKELMQELDEYILRCELDYVCEKLYCIEKSLSDYSIGYYKPNYIVIGDYYEFLEGVEESIKSFGGTERLESMIKMCNGLKHTNLFEYWCKRLCDLFMKEEIKPILDYAEDCSYKIYLGHIDENVADYLDCFVDCYMEGYIYDDENKVLYKPIKKRL